MAEKTVWIKADEGIRYRLGPVRKGKVRQDKYYVLRFRVDGKSYQEALGWESEGVTLAKARIELAKLKEAKRTGEGPKSLRERRKIADEAKKQQEKDAELEKAKNISFSCFWTQEYLLTQSHKSKNSLHTENGLWKKWIEPALGERPVRSLTFSDLEKLKNKMLAEDKAVATIKYTFAVISQMWTLATKLGLVTEICPVKHVSLPKNDNARQRYLTFDEQYSLLEELKKHSPITHDMALISLDCGLRFGEIASLLWEDCRFEDREFLVRDPKSGKNRYGYMTERVYEMLIGRKQANNIGLIFQNSKSEKFVQAPKIYRDITDKIFNQNITDTRNRVCFHTLRHTYASNLAKIGSDLRSIQGLMGHSAMEMTERYAHLDPNRLREIAKKLDEYNNDKEKNRKNTINDNGKLAD